VHYYENMKANLQHLTKESLPTTVKDIRKSILFVRDTMDIFVFAYPDVDQKDSTWLKIRTLLDDGYTVIGAYQDLQYSNPSPDDQAKLLKVCLDWHQEWEDKKKKHNYADFIQNPLPNRLTKPDDLFSYYWKVISKVPKDHLEGAENIARMLHYMNGYSVDTLTKVLLITDPVKLADHEEFHDFRKVLRSIDFVSSFMSFMAPYSIFQAGFDPTPINTYVEVIRTSFGDINDQIANYYFEKDHGADPAHLHDLEVEIDAEWQNVKNNLDTNGFVAQMNALTAGLIPFD